MIALGLLLLSLQAAAVRPVLERPEAGLDDPAAYRGYRTRFFRDARGNAVQVYLDDRTGRVVLLWADAADESAAFTVRDSKLAAPRCRPSGLKPFPAPAPAASSAAPGPGASCGDAPDAKA